MTNPAQRSTFVLGNRLRRAALALALACAIPMIAMRSAQAQTFTILYSFADGGDGGEYPYAGVNLIAGGLYGTASQGGQFRYGAVYELIHRGSGWALSPLYSFTGGSDGSFPYSRVTAGPGGILYGTAYSGRSGYGTVFSLHLHPPFV